MSLKFIIFTKSDLNSSIFFKSFLKKGIEGALKLEKYDYKEPTKIKLDKNNLGQVIAMLTEYGNVILKGKNKTTLTAWQSKSFTTWRGHSSINENNVEEIVSLIEILSNDNQILFAALLTENEYDLKHKVVDEYSYGWEGMSKQDFMNFLPGIYWYTIFGKELVEVIGIEKFKNLPNVIYTEPKNGCIAFHLDEPIDTEDYKLRIKLEKEIVKKIGESYFFDKEKKETEFKHPKKFKDYLNSLESN